jgi:hypothetical protein
VSDLSKISGLENPGLRGVEAVFQLLHSELRQSTGASEQNCRDVAARLANEVTRICERSSRIQTSGDIESWVNTLANHRLRQVLSYYKLGSQQGRVELKSTLSGIVYRYITPQSSASYQVRLTLIEDFLHDFYVEALNAFRGENSVNTDYRPRTLLELAEYMAFTERYAKRRIHLPDLPGDRAQQLIIWRSQSFSQKQRPETITLDYHVSLSVSLEEVSVGGELVIAICLSPAETIGSTAYRLEIQSDEAVGGELNIFLTAPGFQFNGNNTTSLPLDPDDSGEVFPQQLTQNAHFSLTALRPGLTTIKAELFCGDTFQRSIETEVQVVQLKEAELRPLNAARSRPVPQPDLILQVRTAWNKDTSAFTFRYHIDTFQQRLLFADDSDYCSESLPAGLVERSHLLLKSTLEDAASSLTEDF